MHRKGISCCTTDTRWKSTALNSVLCLFLSLPEQTPIRSSSAILALGEGRGFAGTVAQEDAPVVRFSLGAGDWLRNSSWILVSGEKCPASLPISLPAIAISYCPLLGMHWGRGGFGWCSCQTAVSLSSLKKKHFKRSMFSCITTVQLANAETYHWYSSTIWYTVPVLAYHCPNNSFGGCSKIQSPCFLFGRTSQFFFAAHALAVSSLGLSGLVQSFPSPFLPSLIPELGCLG